MYITDHCLDHVRSLGAEVFDCVEDVYQSLSLHSLYGSAQGTECTSSANTSTAGGVGGGGSSTGVQLQSTA